MANNSLLTFMKGFTWNSNPSSPSDKSRHPGAQAEFEDFRTAQEAQENQESEPTPSPYDADPNSTHRTIRVGRESVEIDVEAVKQFVETVREHSSAKT